MKKILLLSASAIFALSSCSSDGGGNPKPGPGSGEMVFRVSTNEKDVENVYIGSREGGEEAPYSYFIELTGAENKSFELTAASMKVMSGAYNVKATTPVTYTMPAFDVPVYKGEVNITVPADGRETASITLTQANAGIKIVFDASIKEYYSALTAKLEDNAVPEKVLSYGYDDATKTAYFDPATIKLSLSDGGTPVQIGGEDFVTFEAKKKQVWTVTLKTSNSKPSYIDFELNVDTSTDDQTSEWGVGEVEAAGTYSDPYSVKDAVNAMPATDVWVEGYVVAPATVVSRSGENAIYIGMSTASDPADCIVIEVASSQYPLITGLTDPSYVGKKVKFKGDVTGQSQAFTSDAKAVMAIVDFESESRETGVNGTAPITLSGKVLSDIGAEGSIFRMGATIKTDNLIKTGAPQNYIDLVKRDFNSMTFEYEMKTAAQVAFNDNQSKYGYRLQWIEQAMQFAEDFGTDVHGHALVWYKDVPYAAGDYADAAKEWNLTNYSADEIKTMLEEHIERMMTTYSYARSWDVVNEAINNSNGGYWDCIWKEIYGGGEEYVREAFRIARNVVKKHNLKCKLFYNDYKTEYYPVKRRAITDMINKLNAEHAAANDGEVLIDGIGLQMHLYLGENNKAGIEAAIDAAMETGLLIHISELSVALYSTTPVAITNELLEEQMQMFNDVFDVAFEKIPQDKFWGITTWGVTDTYSIYTANQGMLFDKDFKAKRPYFDIIEKFQK